MTFFVYFYEIFSDLGQYLRDQLQSVLGATNILSVNDKKFESQFKSLDNIANDVYLKKYPRSLTSTSTGLTGDQCRQVLSSEFLEYLKDDKKR